MGLRDKLKPVYIYSLNDPINNDVKYIGQTVSMFTRLKAHLLCKGSNKKLNEWIGGLNKFDLMPIALIIEECQHENANYRESFHIREAIKAGKELYNISQTGKLYGSYSTLNNIEMPNGLITQLNDMAFDMDLKRNDLVSKILTEYLNKNKATA